VLWFQRKPAIVICWNCEKPDHRFDDCYNKHREQLFAKSIISKIKHNPNRSKNVLAEICIEKTKYTALLDSGATISCAGGKVAHFLLSLIKAKRCSGSFRAANSECQSEVVGKVVTEVTFRGKTALLDIFLIPGLKQEIYLGI